MEKFTFLTFILGTEQFAVDVENVLEVLEQQKITRVPKAPPHIMGIINFRGEILPVMNSRQKFNLMSLDAAEKTYVIVYSIQDNENFYTVAATADGVKDVISIQKEDIKPVPEMGINFDTKFITGAIKDQDAFVMVIKPEVLFSVNDNELVIQ